MNVVSGNCATDDRNGIQGYRAAMKGGRFHYSASIECDKRN